MNVPAAPASRRVAALVLALLVVACGGQRAPNLEAVTGASGELLPARARRLTNVELERSVREVLGIQVEMAHRLPPDVRQEGYSPNADQALVAAAGVRWAALVEEFSERAVRERPQQLVPCGSTACRDEFITQLGQKAWRRPLSGDERRSLARVYELGRADGGAPMGAQLTLSALLQSPSFLYATELGEAQPGAAVVRLTEYEIASLLSFTLSGGPPDEELLRLAARGSLSSADSRAEQAWRILSKHSTRHHFRRFVLEWLEVDELAATAKDIDQHPRYELLKPHMLSETENFVDEVMVHHGASVAALLAGGFVSVDPSMARYYGLQAFGPVVPSANQGRVGVLQHASFLSSHAHPDGTSPVKRGDFILRRVLCRRMPRPAELGIEVVMPPPVAGQTTRERFAQHTADPQCTACHQSIDPLGYTFESFDAAGKRRDADQGKPIDTRVRFSLDGQQLQFDDSAELSRWLASHPKTARCFAQQAFRYFSAQAQPEVESAFLRLVDELPPDRRGSLVDVLVAFAASDLFIYRRAEP